MILHILEARHIGGYQVEVGFNDGKKGVADLTDAINGGIFESLKDESEFARFVIDPELDTLVWANGADLAPEYIYFQAFKSDVKLRPKFIEWGYLAD